MRLLTNSPFELRRERMDQRFAIVRGGKRLADVDVPEASLSGLGDEVPEDRPDVAAEILGQA